LLNLKLRRKCAKIIVPIDPKRHCGVICVSIETNNVKAILKNIMKRLKRMFVSKFAGCPVFGVGWGVEMFWRWLYILASARVDV
jgi:hypothetical protein